MQQTQLAPRVLQANLHQCIVLAAARRVKHCYTLAALGAGKSVALSAHVAFRAIEPP
ncbi:MAG: hypothetical protein ACKVP1_08320 [Burkholderiaceae bacterium]